ncbi:hypothetical protein IW140_004295 [Coemansia sp. RSA 1813]|nr:hypothetical protein IW138_004466 [Coemansia sp. RSA 986]KAJ2567860.1 hypothetical protein IW140_004295 [Coemansia sp. RSA 1813]
MPAPGEGRINCQMTAGRLHQMIESAYPLKIISPQAVPNTRSSDTDGRKGDNARLYPAVGYILTYGGGIVHGDQIHVNVQVGCRCALLMLTQGSTKVFRHRRAGGRQPSFLKNEKLDAIHDINQTYQTMLIDIEPGALACLLPDPVTCFEGAMYNQRQAVRLHDPWSSSLVLLDWMTSGRMSRGERWAFDKYFSVNIVSVLDKSVDDSKLPKSHDTWINGSRIIIRDALLLNNKEDNQRSSSLAQRLESVDVFAYLLVIGPAVVSIADLFRKLHLDQRIKPFRPNNVSYVEDDEDVGIVWSVSEVDEIGARGVAVRIAGPDTENVKSWIKRRLASLQYIVGDSAWSMYYNA